MCFCDVFFTRVKFPPVQRTLTKAMLHLCADLVLEGSRTEVVLRTLTRHGLFSKAIKDLSCIGNLTTIAAQSKLP